MTEGKRNLAYRYRIYPTDKQCIMLWKTFGCCRFIYNRMLTDKKQYYEKTGQSVRITPANYKKEFTWLKEVDSLALANVQLHLEAAYKAFFRDPKTGYPRYKTRHDSRQSYTTNVVNGNIRLENGAIRLPKIGMVKVKIHRSAPEAYRLKSVTVSWESTDKYYISMLYEEDCENQAEDQQCIEKVLGIDYAMHGLAVFSNGERAEYPGYYKAAQEKLAREQRKLSHCEKGSKNYIKQKKKVSRCHEKVRHQRKDFLHKLSHCLSNEYDAIAVEDLNMKSMSRGLHFGKSVMDNGNGMFREQLRYKLERQGKKLIKIDRFFPSSKTCSCCGRVKKDLSLSERVYICECGNVMDRDLNAAINIRNEGLRMLVP